MYDYFLFLLCVNVLLIDVYSRVHNKFDVFVFSVFFTFFLYCWVKIANIPPEYLEKALYQGNAYLLFIY